MHNPSQNIIQYVLNSSTEGFPPSFEGNAWIYGFALFCTMIATLVSIVQVYFIAREIKTIPDKRTSPLNIYRYQLILTYLSILFAAGPDAVYLWTYGEVSAATTQVLLLLDRVFDSLFIIPFLIFTWLQLKCGSVLRFQLINRAIPMSVQVDKKSMRMNGLVGTIILLMSVAVTISK